MRKAKFIGLLALLAATLFAGSAFAANLIEVNVTSEPVHQFATDEKSGSYTMAFDTNTVIEHGDQITIDLPLAVSLSRDIDIMIPFDGVFANNTNAAFEGGVDDDTDAVLAVAAEAQFYISGDAGTQRVTIDVWMDDGAGTAVPGGTLTIGADPTSRFYLQFFNQNTDGVFVELDDDDAYDDVADAADNTRCIDVSAYSGTVVKDSIDSKEDKYTVDPSDPQVAHIVAAVTVSIYECDKTVAGYIELGERTSTQFEDTETCVAFDFEDNAGYCDADTNNLLILRSSQDFEDTLYTLQLEILTNGVYWADDTVGSLSKETAAELCDVDDDPSDRYLALIADADYMTDDADGILDKDLDALDIADMGENVNECDVTSDAAAKSLQIDAWAPINGANQRFLWIDMPALNYDLDEITEGSVVQVKVYLTKVPCGEVIEATINLGTLGCPEAVVDPPSYSVTYPYFTQITGDSFWDGFAIVNESANDGTATLMIYEADGDIWTMDVDVDAQGMYVVNTSALLSATNVSSNGSGVIGDARFYMTATTDFTPVDGFAMIANVETGESMGYLPRQD